MKKLAFIVISCCALISCSENEYTVDEFMKNEQLWKEWLKKCDNGEVRPELLNCINAYKAKDKLISHNVDFFKNFGK